MDTLLGNVQLFFFSNQLNISFLLVHILCVSRQSTHFHKYMLVDSHTNTLARSSFPLISWCIMKSKTLKHPSFSRQTVEDLPETKGCKQFFPRNRNIYFLIDYQHILFLVSPLLHIFFSYTCKTQVVVFGYFVCYKWKLKFNTKFILS